MKTLKRQDIESCYQTEIVHPPLGKRRQDAITGLFNRAPYPHFYQTWEWYGGLYFPKSFFFVLTYRKKALEAYSIIRRISYPVIDREKYIVERGPVFSDIHAFDTHLRHLLNLLKPTGIWLKISPHIIGGPDSLKNVMADIGFKDDPRDHQFYASTVVVDLESPISKIKSHFRRSLVTQLNKAKRLNIIAQKCDNLMDFQSFFNTLNFFRDKKGLEPIRNEGLHFFFQNIFKQQVKGIVMYAKRNDSMLAGIALFRNGNRLIYEWGFSSFNDAHRKLPLSHILHWEGIKWAKQEGFSFYDFGGYWAERGNKNPINRFKTGFSNLIQALPQAQIYYFRPRLSYMMDRLSLAKHKFFQR